MLKDRLYILSISAILAALLLSCSKENTGPDVPGTDETTVPLVFSPVASWPEISSAGAAGTKTNWLINNQDSLKKYGISLLANATRIEGNATAVYPVFKNSTLSFTGGTWNYDGPVKYWISGTDYKFTAFSPYAGNTGGERTISNGTVAVAGTDSEPYITITGYNTGRVTTGENPFDARNEDLVVATEWRDNSGSEDYSPVSLEFTHLLSCISFNIRNATNEDIVKIDNIKLEGLKYQCNININLQGGANCENIDLTAAEKTTYPAYFTSDNRPASGESSPFLPKGMTEQEFKPLFDCREITVLPQSVFGNNIKVSFRIHYTENGEGVLYEGNLGNIESLTSWIGGKKYKYNITISSQDIIFQVEEVPWIEHRVEL